MAEPSRPRPCLPQSCSARHRWRTGTRLFPRVRQNSGRDAVTKPLPIIPLPHFLGTITARGKAGGKKAPGGEKPLDRYSERTPGAAASPDLPLRRSWGGGSEPEGRGARTSEPAHRRRRGPDAGKGRPPGPGRKKR